VTERLQKKDRQVLIDALKTLDLMVESTAERVVGWHEHGDYACGFYWSKKRQAWRFDSPRPYVHTWEDLRTTMAEFRWDQRGIEVIEGLHGEWNKSRSESRWKRYRGAVAAFYMRLRGLG
jgi:hypothetical protein